MKSGQCPRIEKLIGQGDLAIWRNAGCTPSRSSAVATASPKPPTVLWFSATTTSRPGRRHCATMVSTSNGLNPLIDLRISASTEYARFEQDDFDLDIVYGEPADSPYEKVPLAVERLMPLCTPAIAATITAPEDLLNHKLIQCDVQLLKWKGWFEANNLRPPTQYGLRFDRSSMAIAAAVDGLGVVLESNLLGDRELRAGKLVCPLQGKTKEVNYVGHHLMYPKRLHRHAASESFKTWLLKSLSLGDEVES